MPVVPSDFCPPGYLANGHTQSILAAFRPKIGGIPWTRDRLELPDGDFLLIDRVGDFSAKGRPTVVITHGMEGHSRDVYVSGLATECLKRGWSVVAWNQRGCGGEPNRLLRAYHSGDTSDLLSVLATVTGIAPIALVGFSLGGNLSLKLAGEGRAPDRIVACAAISAPVDLAACANALDRRWTNRIYQRRLIAALTSKVIAKSELFPGKIEAARFREIKTFKEFDNEFTAPVHGFRDAAEYWAQASSRPHLPNIQIPALLLNALDDPFLETTCFPFDEARDSDVFELEAPTSGGHLGFLSALPASSCWADQRITSWLGRTLPNYPSRSQVDEE